MHFKFFMLYLVHKVLIHINMNHIYNIFYKNDLLKTVE